MWVFLLNLLNRLVFRGCSAQCWAVLFSAQMTSIPYWTYGWCLYLVPLLINAAIGLLLAGNKINNNKKFVYLHLFTQLFTQMFDSFCHLCSVHTLLHNCLWIKWGMKLPQCITHAFVTFGHFTMNGYLKQLSELHYLTLLWFFKQHNLGKGPGAFF